MNDKPILWQFGPKTTETWLGDGTEVYRVEHPDGSIEETITEPPNGIKE